MKYDVFISNWLHLSFCGISDVQSQKEYFRLHNRVLTKGKEFIYITWFYRLYSSKNYVSVIINVTIKIQ